MSAANGSGLVLVVDDDADIRWSLGFVLEGGGYRVATAANGAEALSSLRGGGPLPDVILLDLRMPVMDGQQFRETQLRDPALARVPVVALSGDADLAARSRAMGIERFLLKPVDLDRLLSELGRYSAPSLA
ncbi:MAG TPA: response regulator [Myxococcales bacterium]|jgi:CheY-like chemotaxis protein